MSRSRVFWVNVGINWIYLYKSKRDVDLDNHFEAFRHDQFKRITSMRLPKTDPFRVRITVERVK